MKPTTLKSQYRSINAYISICMRGVLITIFVVFLMTIAPLFTYSQNSSLSQQAAVKLDDKTLLVLQDKFLSSSLEKRAEIVTDRIEKIADNYSIPVEALTVDYADIASIIHAEDLIILSVSDAEAKAVNLSRSKLTNQYLKIIKNAVSEYRQERSFTYLIRATSAAGICTIILIFLLLILWNIMPRFYSWVNQHQMRWLPNIRIQNLILLSSHQISTFIQGLIRSILFAIILIIFYFYLYFVLSLFPQTRELGISLSTRFIDAVVVVGNLFLGYLPNLLIIGLIIFLTRYCLRLLKLICVNIERGRLNITGFFPEWANPTYQLLSFLIIALAAAISFPYLPGSNSLAFQAISIVIGAIISIGSTNAIANAVSGFILVYTRAFKIGDRIQVGDLVGFIEDKQLFATGIRTINNILVTMPNSTLLSSNIINYTLLVREKKSLLIIHTTVTLGYDVPWSNVYQALIAAALVTNDILSEPAPLVWQTALNDFYVSYELRVYTKNSLKLEDIYSELHQNIQNKCNEVGIEICSPHYSAIRDGNQTTIPSEYLSNDYSAPGFRVNPLSSLFNKE